MRALGKGISKGEITYVKPDHPLNGDGKWQTLTIIGLEMIFMDASGTEGASEMTTYIPLWTAELTYQGMHNVYTLRGAKVRDSQVDITRISFIETAPGGNAQNRDICYIYRDSTNKSQTNNRKPL